MFQRRILSMFDIVFNIEFMIDVKHNKTQLDIVNYRRVRHRTYVRLSQL